MIFRYNIDISDYIGNAAFVNHFYFLSFLIPKMISYLFLIYISALFQNIAYLLSVQNYYLNVRPEINLMFLK